MVDFSVGDVGEERVGLMTETLNHRGPDDSGVYLTEHAGLGHTRLSIIDLSSAGHQPMVSEDGLVILVYNGELYNFRELRDVLQSKGVTFFSQSDSEVVLKAYRHWGVDAFARFKGMFAFAVWDKTKRQLHAARDRFGIKPFYFSPTPKGVVFGSEIKALLASGKGARTLDIKTLPEYLYYGTALGEHTLFEGIRKLLPGHHLKVDETGFHVAPFASKYELDPIEVSEEEAGRETFHYLDRAVKSHLVSDVPVGVFLSGGIDSSTITALASRHYRGRLKTFSVGFDYEKGVDELAKARLVAQHCGSEHHELHIAGKNMPDVIENLVRCHDQPFGDAANIPLYLLCRELKGTIKVILQGDGGDEIFAGYRRYNVLDYERLWHHAARWASPLFRALPTSPAVHRYRRFLQAMKQVDPALRMALLLTEEPLAHPPTRILSMEMRRAITSIDPFARYRAFFRRFRDLPPVQRMLYTDCGILLPDIFLEKVDKATMAHGIEVRVPMLDTDLTRYIMALSPSLKVRRGQKKRLIRQAMRGIVPNAILDGPKTGFGVPYAWWLREPLAQYMRSILLDKATLDWGIFDRAALESCIHEHLSGKKNNGFLLYKILNLAIWHRFFLSSPSLSSPSPRLQTTRVSP